MGSDRNFQRDVGSRSEILQVLAQDYRSAIVDWMQTHGRRLEHGETAIVLAREFGFCYGVDRAVEYAYETRRRFPDRRIFITGRDHPQSPGEPPPPGNGDPTGSPRSMVRPARPVP